MPLNMLCSGLVIPHILHSLSIYFICSRVRTISKRRSSLGLSAPGRIFFRPSSIILIWLYLHIHTSRSCEDVGITWRGWSAANFDLPIFTVGSSFLNSLYASFAFTKSSLFCLSSLPLGIPTDTKSFFCQGTFYWSHLFLRNRQIILFLCHSVNLIWSSYRFCHFSFFSLLCHMTQEWLFIFLETGKRQLEKEFG